MDFAIFTLPKSPKSSTLMTPPALVAVWAALKLLQGKAREHVVPPPVLETQV